jgi:hypothetical protein
MGMIFDWNNKYHYWGLKQGKNAIQPIDWMPMVRGGVHIWLVGRRDAHVVRYQTQGQCTSNPHTENPFVKFG